MQTELRPLPESMTELFSYKLFHFQVPGKIVPKKRARHASKQQADGSYKPVTYSDKDTVSYEQEVRRFWQEQFGYLRNIKDNEGNPKAKTGFIIEVVLCYPRPRSHYGGKSFKLKSSAMIPPITMTDTDNMLKTIKDALNSWAYIDDRQVFKDTVERRYIPWDEEPFVDIKIYEAVGPSDSLFN